jgi:hypothetical protein
MKFTLGKALLIIVISTLLISGTTFGAVLYYRHFREMQRNDPSYHIVAVVQTSPHVEGLKTSYLAELMGLSVDQPRNLFQFRTSDAVKQLLASPVIKEATVRKIRPGTVHVDYVARKPIAYLGDYVNAALDSERTVFPFKPFYSPKRLPELYLGEGSSPASALQWGEKIGGKEIELAYQLLDEVPAYLPERETLLRIDVSHAFAQSDGQREIVLLLEERVTRHVEGRTVQCIYPRIIRMRPDTYINQLKNYQALSTHFVKSLAVPKNREGAVWRSKALIIDMRLSDLAFFVEES